MLHSLDNKKLYTYCSTSSANIGTSPYWYSWHQNHSVFAHIVLYKASLREVHKTIKYVSIQNLILFYTLFEVVFQVWKLALPHLMSEAFN